MQSLDRELGGKKNIRYVFAFTFLVMVDGRNKIGHFGMVLLYCIRMKCIVVGCFEGSWNLMC